jgi:hypothetical protein
MSHVGAQQCLEQKGAVNSDFPTVRHDGKGMLQVCNA